MAKMKPSNLRESGRRALAVIAAAALLLLPAVPAAAQSGGFGKAGSPPPPAAPGRETMKPAGQESSPASAGPGRATTRAMKMTKDVEKKLDKLPPDQLVEVGGKPMTVREIRAKNEQLQRQQNARAQTEAGDFASKLPEIAKKFESAQQDEIAAHNAKVKAELAKLEKQGPAPAPAAARSADAIKAEALAIQKRVKAGTATPQDEARVPVLLDQYQQLK